jgi:hypothetical protein
VRLRRGAEKISTRNREMADRLGRFGMAVTVIALIATGLYQFSGRVSIVEPGAFASSFIPRTNGR